MAERMAEAAGPGQPVVAPTTATVRRLLGIALREPQALPELSAPELDLCLRLLRRARLLGRIESSRRFTHPVPDILRSARVIAESRARVARWEMDRLAWALTGVDGPVLVLKGCAYLLLGTPNATGRSFADVDLLLPAEALPAAEAALKARGWSATELTPYDDRYYRDWAHELPPMQHPEREVEVDLHHNIVMPTGYLKPDAAELIAAARPIEGTRFHALAPVDMVLHAAVHLFYGGEMDGSLRELVDIADLLQHFDATEPGFRDAFWPRAEALGLLRPAFYAVRYVERLLELRLPAALAAAPARAAPSRPVLALMDALVPLALYPYHPERRARSATAARQALFIRSHWVKMPPLMLARHLGAKTLARLRHQMRGSGKGEPGAAG